MKKHIPFLSFAKMNRQVKNDLQEAFNEVIDSSWYILGNKVDLFEKQFASFCKVPFCTGVANGLDALILALKALNIGPGDEVIVPSNTYIASWLAVSYTGATPVPVEPRPDTCNIDPGRIEEKITSKTKAIMPVHLYGQCCEMTVILALAARYNLFVVEDNAQAQGASCNNKKTGSFGHLNATSFYPGKNLGAYGDAGAVTTADEVLNTRVRTLRNYGSSVKYYNEIKGVNSRLDELQAAFLSVKLPYLEVWNNERIQIANTYTLSLQQTGDLILPSLANGVTSVYHLYVIRTEKRDELQKFLESKGIGTLIHYPVPPHLQQAYTDLKYKKGDFPIAEKMAATCLSLPLYPGLDEEEQAYIADTIKSFYHG